MELEKKIDLWGLNHGIQLRPRMYMLQRAGREDCVPCGLHYTDLSTRQMPPSSWRPENWDFSFWNLKSELFFKKNGSPSMSQVSDISTILELIRYTALYCKRSRSKNPSGFSCLEVILMHASVWEQLTKASHTEVRFSTPLTWAEK